MNSINQHIDQLDQDCEQFEPLVSAMMDGELSGEELDSVKSHLAVCESCRQLQGDFEAVNHSVVAMVNDAVHSARENNSYTETFVVTRQKQSLGNWFSPWRLVPLAAVAALMVGLFIVTTNQTAPEATAEQLTPEQFVKPMTDLNRINHQQQRDQELMLRTLGMDLRSLKLELKQLENAGPEERTRFENQIEEMLTRVEQFEAR